MFLIGVPTLASAEETGPAARAESVLGAGFAIYFESGSVNGSQRIGGILQDQSFGYAPEWRVAGRLDYQRWVSSWLRAGIRARYAGSYQGAREGGADYAFGQWVELSAVGEAVITSPPYIDILVGIRAGFAFNFIAGDFAEEVRRRAGAWGVSDAPRPAVLGGLLLGVLWPLHDAIALRADFEFGAGYMWLFEKGVTQEVLGGTASSQLSWSASFLRYEVSLGLEISF